MDTLSKKKSSAKIKSEKSFLTRQRNEALKTLSDIARLLQASKKEENPLTDIVRIVRKAMKVDVCSLYILQDSQLVLVATTGLALQAIGKVKMPLDKGLTGLVAESREPVIAKEARQHPRFQYFPQTREERFISFAGVPILERGTLAGVMTIQTKEPRDFTDEAIDLLQVISGQLANVIRNLVTLEEFRHKPGLRRSKPNKYSGIGASPGIVVGPAFIFRTQWGSPIPTVHRISREVENRRLKQALKDAMHDLRELEQQLMKKLSEKESDIFTAHRMILKDRSFREKLNKEVDKKRSAEEAVMNVMSDYVATFSKLADPYLKERAADIEDLAQRLLKKLRGDSEPTLPKDFKGILIAERLTPSETALLDPDRIRGIITVHGGQTSHAAILARSLGIPAVMGVNEEILTRVGPRDLIIVDGNTGDLFVRPPQVVVEEYEKVQKKQANRLVQLNMLADVPAITKDGRHVHLEANIGIVSSMRFLKQYGAEGVGLYRTEFPFMIRETLPNEEDQYRVYRRIIESADGLPVTFRTLDAGGDKPISYLHLEEDESFLGYRSIRLCLAEPHILKTQLKALLRAACHGPIRILLPMISGLEEIRDVKKLIRQVKADLRKRKDPIRIPNIPLGIMIEVPSAVQLAHLLIKEVDFFSIGTNDLIQFTLAVDRNNERVAEFFEPLHPAVIQSLWQVVQAAHKNGKSASICGEMAGDPLMTTLLVGLGFDRLSMIPANIPAVKQVILGLEYRKLLKDIRQILDMPTTSDIKRRMARYMPKDL